MQSTKTKSPVSYTHLDVYKRQVLGLSQMFMCEEILTEGALAGLGKTMQASVISVIFTAARIPLALLLSATALGLSGIWWAITPVSYTHLDVYKRQR